MFNYVGAHFLRHYGIMAMYETIDPRMLLTVCYTVVLEQPTPLILYSFFPLFPTNPSPIPKELCKYLHVSSTQIMVVR